MNLEIFKRIEKKYYLTEVQYQLLLKRLEDKMEKDHFFQSHILNIYFDTPNYDLIQKSIEKPVYKEKIRLRSYGVPKMDDKVFLEVKKKYKDIVNKRRVTMTLKEFYQYIEAGIFPDVNPQIMKEIDYCFKTNQLEPKIMIGYIRESYYLKENPNFRITFDHHLYSRHDHLHLDDKDTGELYAEEPFYLLELKTLTSIPIWLSQILSELKIYPTSFSKYGNIYKKWKGECIC